MSIAVLSICRNDRKGLEATVASVASQTRRPDEFIVLDGASTDDTVTYLETSSVQTLWKSEPYNGIADAFNKVALLASSDWVVYLNAGDTFADPGVLSDVSDFLGSLSEETGVCYGDCIVVDPKGYEPTRRIQGRHTLDSKGCPICHQAAFIRRPLQLSTPYDQRLRIAMDYDLWHRLLKKTRFVRFDRVICIYKLGGISSSREWGEHSIIAHHMVDWLNSDRRKLDYREVAALLKAVIGYRTKKRLERMIGISRYARLKSLFKTGSR